MKPSSFIIAAPTSDSGKSTITIGLLRALSRQGYRVQPFKCGPDYIDPKLHKNASGVDSVNLDLFMQSEESVQTLFSSYQAPSDVAVVEGVMGLFDGYDRDRGSTAHLAEVLDLPIVLVLTPKSMAYSVAPLLYGIKHFRPELNILGVIFNKVNSPKHLAYLRDAANDVGVKVLGSIPTDKTLTLPSRHLGLITDDQEALEAHANQAANLVEAHINLTQLLADSQYQPISTISPIGSNAPKGTKKIAVARDEAFNFIYTENIRLLEQFGTISYFSPIQDRQLPECDLLYLPGGYPELYAEQLTQNSEMIQQIKTYAERQAPLIAECGGMIYLSKSIITAEGKEYPMVGLFNHSATMEGARLTIGYRQLELFGVPLKGHEFHYSHLTPTDEGVTNQLNATGEPVDTLLFQRGKVIATYTHLTFTAEFLSRLLEP